MSPRDLIQLAIPGTGVVNFVGNLLIVPVSKFSLEHKKFVTFNAFIFEV